MATVVTQVNANQAAMAGKTPAAALRTACNELVGTTLFGTLLRQARESSLNSDLMDSPGQRMFASQLDSMLLERSADKLGSGVGEALYRQLSQNLQGKSRALDLRA